MSLATQVFAYLPPVVAEKAIWVSSFFENDSLYYLIIPYCLLQPVFRNWARTTNVYESNKPTCKYVMASYNLIMTLFSFVCAVTMVYCLVNLQQGVFSVGHFADPKVGGVYTKIVYAFYLSKYIEFLDTYFLLLCDRPVTWLQYLHHIGAPLDMGILYHFQAEGAWIFVAFNGTIHTFMYYYYACCILKWKFPFPKNLITILQLLQFVSGLGVYGFYYFVPDYMRSEQKRFALGFTYAYVLMNLVLFINFYLQTYVFKKVPKKKAS